MQEAKQKTKQGRQAFVAFCSSALPSASEAKNAIAA
jgi:hypothetical protein